MFYKLVDDKTIIGAVTSDDFRKYQVKHKRILISDEENAQFVEYKDVYYYDDWLRALPENSNFSRVFIDIVKISENEYENLKSQLDEGDMPEDDSLEEIIVINEEPSNEEEPIIVQKTAVQILNERLNDIENALIELAGILSEIK
jgi:hypothetical protein